jgi:hypothetical protein
MFLPGFGHVGNSAATCCKAKVGQSSEAQLKVLHWALTMLNRDSIV